LRTDVTTLTTNKANVLDPTLQGWVTVATKGHPETSLSLNSSGNSVLYFNQGGNQAKMFYNSGDGIMFTSQAGPMRFFPANPTATGNASLSLNTNGTATFNGVVSGATPGVGDNSTNLATTAFVNTYYAPRANPTFTGTVTAPDPAVASNNQTVPTTSWVRNYSAPKTSPSVDSSLTVQGNAQDVLLNINSNLASRVSRLKLDNTDKANGGTGVQMSAGSEISICNTTADKAIRFRQGTDAVANDAFIIHTDKRCEFKEPLKQATLAVQENLPTSGNVVIRAENTATDGNARLAVRVPAGECRMVASSTGMSISTDGVLPIRFQPGGNEVATINTNQTTYNNNLWASRLFWSSNIFMERRCSGSGWSYRFSPDQRLWKTVIFDLTETTPGVPFGRRPSGVTVADWWSANGYRIRQSGVYTFKSKVFFRMTYVGSSSFEFRIRLRAQFPDGRIDTLWENSNFKRTGDDFHNIEIEDTQFLSQDTVVIVEVWGNLPVVSGSTTHGFLLDDSLATPLSLYKIHLVN
jgi:hypothetical protein